MPSIPLRYAPFDMRNDLRAHGGRARVVELVERYFVSCDNNDDER